MIVTDDGSLGSSRDQRTRTSPTFATNNRPLGRTRESVAGKPKRLPVILARFHPRPAHLAALAFPGR